MTPNDSYNKFIADIVIKNLEKRNIVGYYAQNKEEAVNTVLSLIDDNSSISWGGSYTMEEIGLLDKLKEGNYTLIDRSVAKTPEEKKELYRKAFSVNYYLTSSNAITKDGELLNIDGTGNRVSALIYGPDNIIMVVGINKITRDIDSAYKRVKDIACIKNAIRLDKKTPCVATGSCKDCLSPDCICSHTVITRRSAEKDRIKVVIVGENLGY